MTKVAILIDGGYVLKRLPVVRRFVDTQDAASVADELKQLVRSHLEQLNEHYEAPLPMRLLYRTFCYDARPYSQKAHTAVDRRPLDYAKSEQARFRTALFNALYNVPKLAVRLGEVRKDRNRSWTLNAEPQRDLLTGTRGARQLPGTNGGAWHQAVRDVPMDPHGIMESTLWAHAQHPGQFRI